ncbi:MAG TPA: helix-turn-helix transcriptional regulator [Actinomycetes bacterium]|nr:helix-turn-helix transcriptional regulator [Actinomycetes bacterium]
MDPWHIGPRLRYWRKRRGLSIAAFAALVGRSSSWVQMAETGRRAPYNLLDLVNVARVLRIDLGAFLCDAVPGLPEGDQQQILLTLRDAFQGHDPRRGMARLASRVAEADAEGDLMLVVLPGGQWKVVNRRDALKLGAVLGVSLAAPDLNPHQAGELVASIQTREVSRAGVGALRAVVAAYRRLDDEIGSTALRPLVEHNLRVVKGLRAKSSGVQVALGSVAAEMDQLAGWLCFDDGDDEGARTHFGRALRAADQAGSFAVAAHALSQLSYVETDAHNPLAAINAAESGLARAAKTPSHRLRASIGAFQARAHAEAGEANRAKAAIGHAEEALHAARHEDDPPFMYYFDRAVLDGHAGLAYATLGEPRPADHALSRAVAEVSPAFVRDRAVYLVYRAQALAIANEIVESCQVALQAADLLDQASSGRTAKLLKELHAIQLRPHWRLPEVRELGDRLYEL